MESIMLKISERNWTLEIYFYSVIIIQLTVIVLITTNLQNIKLSGLLRFLNEYSN